MQIKALLPLVLLCMLMLERSALSAPIALTELIAILQSKENKVTAFHMTVRTEQERLVDPAVLQSTVKLAGRHGVLEFALRNDMMLAKTKYYESTTDTESKKHDEVWCYNGQRTMSYTAIGRTGRIRDGNAAYDKCTNWYKRIYWALGFSEYSLSKWFQLGMENGVNVSVTEEQDNGKTVLRVSSRTIAAYFDPEHAYFPYKQVCYTDASQREIRQEMQASDLRDIDGILFPSRIVVTAYERTKDGKQVPSVRSTNTFEHVTFKEDKVSLDLFKLEFPRNISYLDESAK